jgi:excisionase family DNA binding protein
MLAKEPKKTSTKDLPLKGKMLTTSEASLILNIHENTLRRWCDEGKLKYYRISIRGDRRFVIDDIISMSQKIHHNNGFLG